jgi:hypothetical protein
MTSITHTDLIQYPMLRTYLLGLYDKIIEGKQNVLSENTFETYHNLLFPPKSTTSYAADNKLTTGTKGLTTLDNKTISLKNLLINTLFPTLNATINTNATPDYNTYANDSFIDSVGTKDHLCFIKFNNTKTDIEPDNYSITNILYSKYAIEIFIRIIDALLDCYSNNSKDLETKFASSTKIYIVNRKLKGADVIGVSKGLYISSVGQNIDDPPEGIYLYIGDLKNMFKDDDIKVVDKSETPISSKTNYLNSDMSIFSNSNKLQYTETSSGTRQYFFGFLEYLNIAGSDAKYLLQSGTSEKPTITSTGTMTNVTLNAASISAVIKSGSVIASLKILPDSKIEKVTRAGVAQYTYKLTSGKISGIISAGSTSKIASDSVIINEPAKITLSSSSVFSKTGSNPTANVKQGSIPTIKPGADLKTSGDIDIDTAITIPGTGISVTDFEFVTTTPIASLEAIGVSSVTINAQIDSSTNTIPVDITVSTTLSKNITILGTFDNLEGAAETPSSFYKQNIYYIFNFIKMINNINKDSFSPTIKYLRIYILCYKCLLLASIRAANIFYNNRYKLSAVAISYEDDFIKNSSQSTGGINCTKVSLNDFVKNDNKATFSSSATCTADTEVLPSNTDTPGYKYILYKKKSGSNDDNKTSFNKYDVYLQEELGNIKNNKIKEATSALGITNFIFFSSYKLIDKSFKITCDDSNINDIYEEGIFQNSTPAEEYNKIKKLIDNRNIYEFNNGYRIRVEGTPFKVKDFQIRTDNANKKRINIELEQDKTISSVLYDKLYNYTSNTDTATNSPVYIVKITSKDIDKYYNEIVSNTDTVEQNINMYKTKIKNNTTLYELHKSRNNLLYNQVLSYLIIVAIIISILVIINVAAVEKPLIKSISLVCLAAIIILFMSYYIMNTLYIEEGFVQASGSTYTGYDLCPETTCKITNADVGTSNIKHESSSDIRTVKKDDVKNFLNTNAKELMFMITLATPSIVNDSLKGNNEKLVTISKNIYNEKLYLKDVLFSKKSDSEMNVDVLKYENKNYDVYIICILFLALIMVGSYTINIYTDNKYLDLLILIMVILFVCLFTYFVLYTNRIVRTVSTNYYWGNQYENEYI